jgi:ABC-type transport system involved in multi-copper enzyme maturation permease subunit
LSQPVLQREFLLLLRRKSLLEKCWFGWAALAGLVWVLWPNANSNSDPRWIFSAFGLAQLLFCVLLSPAVTAPIITEEKEQDRFGMLFASLLTPKEVLFGKGFSAFLLLFLVLLSASPFFILMLALGSVSWIELLQVVLVSLVALLQCSSLGLYCSCLKDRSYDALLSSYAWLLAIVGLTFVPGYLLSGFADFGPLWACLRSLSPFSAMMEVVAPEMLATFGRLPTSWSLGELWSADLWFYLVAGSFSSFILLWLSLRKVFEFPLGHESSSRPSSKKGGTFRKLLIDPNKTRPPFSISSLIFINELRCKLFGYIGNLIRGIYGGLFLSIALVILVSLSVETLSLDAVKTVALSFQMGLVVLLAPALGAPSISEEIESGTLDMLRLTPISAWALWKGKVKAINAYLLLLLLSSSPIYLMLFLLNNVEGKDPLSTLRIVAIQMLLLLFSTTVGVWSSAFTGKTQKAVGLAYGILLGISAIPFLAPWISPVPNWTPWIESLSPFLAIGKELQSKETGFLPQTYAHMGAVGSLFLLLLIHSLILVHRHMRRAK